jgi:hypothetical protein
MNRCETCKHWGHPNIDYSRGGDIQGRRPCMQVEVNWWIDGGDCNDALYTPADFGCTKHEVRA